MSRAKTLTDKKQVAFILIQTFINEAVLDALSATELGTISLREDASMENELHSLKTVRNAETYRSKRKHVPDADKK